MNNERFRIAAIAAVLLGLPLSGSADEKPAVKPCCDAAAGNGTGQPGKLTAKPGLFGKSVFNPPCDYCSTQHRKGFVKADDRVVAWLRGRHNGGAIPLRHFLAAPRVINDTYGIFFYDPDGGYVAAYEPSPKYKVTYEFHGWRNGVMVVKGSDGNLRSALTGLAFEGPQKGERLARIPNMVTDWQHWLMLHPESVAYQMFDGKRYVGAPLPTEFSEEAAESMGEVDDRLDTMASVLGVTLGGKSKAFPLDTEAGRAVFTDAIDGQPVAVFWYGPTQTAVAFRGELDGDPLTFYADKGSPDTAPFKDRETGTRWTLAGRAVDGKLRGKELEWVDSIQSRWYAWRAEFPETGLHRSAGISTRSASKLDLRLGHLCDQKGCGEHFREALGRIPGLGNVDVRPGLENPGATVDLRPNEAFDVWNFRERMRDRGVEVARLTPHGLGDGYRFRVDLPRWHQPVVEAVENVDWASGVSPADGVIELGVTGASIDLVALLDAITETGSAPSAVWLVPLGASMPNPPKQLPAAPAAEPRTGGSSVHPVVEFDLGPAPDAISGLTAMLNQSAWASRIGIVSGKVTHANASIGDRKYANLTSLLDDFQETGHTPTEIRLREFGDIRIEFEFAHICGEVEMSKPPKPKKGDDKKKKKDEKPFVPKPVRPADSSNGLKAIKAAVESVAWIKDGIFHEYHSRFEFRSPTKLRIALKAAGEDVVRLDDLIDAVRAAGFPPKTVTVSRLHSGIPFGKPLPSQLELTDREGKRLTLASLKRPDRPLAFAFVSLECERDKYKDYEPDPKFYAQLGETIELYQDRVDVIAVSASPKDEFTDVTGFWDRTGLHAPVMHDAQGAVSAVLNAQTTPAPHLFVFDADGLFRYAGDPHNHWGKDDEERDNFLARALDKVLAGEYEDNGGVFYNSKPCDCSSPNCTCPKCRCGSSCRCAVTPRHCGVGF